VQDCVSESLHEVLRPPQVEAGLQAGSELGVLEIVEERSCFFKVRLGLLSTPERASAVGDKGCRRDPQQLVPDGASDHMSLSCPTTSLLIVGDVEPVDCEFGLQGGRLPSVRVG